MNSTGDDELQGGLEPWSPANPPSIEHLAHMAPFPIYGLLETPDDLTLHGIGYCTVNSGWTHPTPQSHLHPSRFLWEVVLHYGYPPGHQDDRPRLELITTNLTGVPMPVPPIDELVRTSAIHYPSEDAVPLYDSQPISLLIERFAIVDGQALAVVAHTPDPPPLTLHPKDVIGIQRHETGDASAAPVPPLAAWSVATPDWSFTLHNAQMRVAGRAYGWTQTALFQVLHQLAPITDKADVLARSQREMEAWGRSIRSS
jgi:hypothetical protein